MQTTHSKTQLIYAYYAQTGTTSIKPKEHAHVQQVATPHLIYSSIIKPIHAISARS